MCLHIYAHTKSSIFYIPSWVLLLLFCFFFLALKIIFMLRNDQRTITKERAKKMLRGQNVVYVCNLISKGMNETDLNTLEIDNKMHMTGKLRSVVFLKVCYLFIDQTPFDVYVMFNLYRKVHDSLSLCHITF